MKRYFFPLFAVAALVFVFGCATPLEKDAEALQGSWSSVDGRAVFTFVGNQLILSRDENKIVTTYELLAETAETPRGIVIKAAKGFGLSEDIFGIYRVDGDSFKLCASRRGFPVEFREDRERRVELAVFQRVKR
ncbi:MAG: hypothetical protein LBV28_04490 [Puniceicoccales bacterium]|jgi:uncharacterized protein (TIGR03067 family)|nr:hypothetical protein [Puniceicoccales bacterium]